MTVKPVLEPCCNGGSHVSLTASLRAHSGKGEVFKNCPFFNSRLYLVVEEVTKYLTVQIV